MPLTDEEISRIVEHDLTLWEEWRSAPEEPLNEELQRAIGHDAALIQSWLHELEHEG